MESNAPPIRRRMHWSQWAMWIGIAALAYLVWDQLKTGIRLLDAEGAIPASALILRDGSEVPVELSSFAGQVVVVNLWAGWCGPCRREIPAINEVYQELVGEGLIILGVNLDDREAGTLDELKERHGVRYPVYRLLEPLRGTFSGTNVIPQTWIVDRRGKIRVAHRGPVSHHSLLGACRKLLAEPPVD